MTARSPSAFFLSASLHGLVVAIVVLFTYLIQTQVKETPKVLELVAGPGDDYGATTAPALGIPGGIKLAIPTPLTPAPQPVKAIAPAPVPVKAAVDKAVTPPSTPNFSRQIKNKIMRSELKAQKEIKKEREAEQKRLTKAEFDRQNKASKVASANTNPKVKHIDTEGIEAGADGGSTSSKTGAGGKALQRDAGDVLDAYFSLVKQKLRDGLEKPPGLSDTLTAVAEFHLNADGSISDARITRSSGSDEFDRAVLEDIRHFSRVAPPTSWNGDTVSLTFRMKEEDDG